MSEGVSITTNEDPHTTPSPTWNRGPSRSQEEYGAKVTALYELFLQEEKPQQTASEDTSSSASGPPPLRDTSDPELNSYEYQPLRTPVSVRVLEIHQAEPLFSSEDPSIEHLLENLPPASSFKRFVRAKQGEIKCSFKEVDLGNAAHSSFDALSYTWGNPLGVGSDMDHLYETKSERCFPITCDGRVIMVAANLFYALQMLRRVSASQSFAGIPRQAYIWIDAICINQEDLAERGSQVAMMDRIYTNARTVIVWLGPDDVNAQEAREAINSLCLIKIGSPQQKMMRSVDLTKPGWHQQLEIPEVTNAQVRALCLFMTRGWFTRAWVLQEIVFANNIVLIYGSAMLPWQTLLQIIALLQESEWHRLIAIGNSLMELPKTVVLGAPIRHKRITTGQLSTLTDILRDCRVLDASDARDKVFAFLSFGEEFAKFPEVLKLDYTNLVQETYVDGTILLIRSTSSLNALCLKEDDIFAKTADLPSWVPDFSVPQRPYPLQLPLAPCTAKFIWHPVENIMARFGYLTVKGMHFDTIKDTTPTWEEMLETEPWVELIKLALSLKPNYQEEFLGRAYSRAEVLWRTLITNTYQSSFPAPLTCAHAFGDWLTFRIYWLRYAVAKLREKEDPSVERIQELVDTLEESIALLAAHEPDDSYFRCDRPRQIHNLHARLTNNKSALDFDVEPFRLFSDKMHTIQQFRRLFTTGLGWLGTGHQSVREQDEIWLLVGLDNPVVLRRLGNGNYRFMGEVYVHGLRDKEASLVDPLSSTVIDLE